MASRPNWIFVLVQCLGEQRKQATAFERAGKGPWDRGRAAPKVQWGYGLYATWPDSWRPVSGGRLYQTDDPLRQGQRASWGNMAIPTDFHDTRAVRGCLCGDRRCPNA